MRILICLIIYYLLKMTICLYPSISKQFGKKMKIFNNLILDNVKHTNTFLLFPSYLGLFLLSLWLNKQNWISYQFTCLQVLDFLKAKDTFISLLLKHLGTSAIMDLMLKLMTQVEGVEMRQNILNVSRVKKMMTEI